MSNSVESLVLKQVSFVRFNRNVLVMSRVVLSVFLLFSSGQRGRREY